MSEEGDLAKFDNFRRQASAIDYRLVDPDHQPSLEEGPIATCQRLYDAYPENVQAMIRRDILPRIRFAIQTGYIDCPACVKGRVSPDREAFVTIKDKDGNDVQKPIAIQKELCLKCGGSGELRDDAVEETGEPVEMTAEEIERKFGVRIKT